MNIENLPRFAELHDASAYPREGPAFDISNEGILHYKAERIDLFHKAMKYGKLDEAINKHFAPLLSDYYHASQRRGVWPAGWYHSVVNKHLREYIKKLDEMFEGYV